MSAAEPLPPPQQPRDSSTPKRPAAEHDAAAAAREVAATAEAAARDSLLSGWDAPPRRPWVRPLLISVAAAAVIIPALVYGTVPALRWMGGLPNRPPTAATPPSAPAATAPASNAPAASTRSGATAPATPASPSATAPSTPATTTPPAPAAPAPPVKPVQQANNVRAVYLTGYSFGSDEKFADIMQFIQSKGLNAIVADVKDDDGRISWEMDLPLAREIGATAPKVKDVRARLQAMREKNVYAIGRIVVFVDPVLAKARPAWAIRNGQWKDRRGLAWTNPYVEEVWRYNVNVAKEAAKAGFQEIQFDYVRFPEHDIEGITHNVGQEKRVKAIADFLRYAKKELDPLGVFVSADVFGLTTTTVDDMKIGQDYAVLSDLVDYISPMVYPSHYGPGIFGLRDPEAAPKETVYHSMVHGQWKTPSLPLLAHRPWIQDFSLRIPYGKAEVEAQLRGIAEAGIRSFMVWDPSNRYTRTVDYSVIDSTKALPLPPKPAPKTATKDAPTADPHFQPF